MIPFFHPQGWVPEQVLPWYGCQVHPVWLLPHAVHFWTRRPAVGTPNTFDVLCERRRARPVSRNHAERWNNSHCDNDNIYYGLKPTVVAAFYYHDTSQTSRLHYLAYVNATIFSKPPSWHRGLHKPQSVTLVFYFSFLEMGHTVTRGDTFSGCFASWNPLFSSCCLYYLWHCLLRWIIIHCNVKVKK